MGLSKTSSIYIFKLTELMGLIAIYFVNGGSSSRLLGPSSRFLGLFFFFFFFNGNILLTVVPVLLSLCVLLWFILRGTLYRLALCFVL